ncbi:MAG: DUF72 domain-containing protein [Syntrophales bacterium]
MNGLQNIHIGTSGWHYDHWRGPFYPEALSRQNYLDYYADHFHTLEINNSFYQMPQEKTLVQWRNAVPPSFIFSIKASRYITHIKKLKDGKQILGPFMKKVELLREKTGPILFQLPPQWRFNPERLSSFLNALSKECRYVFEFRDSSWFCKKTYDILTQHNAAFCIYNVANRTTPKEITADFTYVRLHGPKGANQGCYDIETLSAWADTFISWRNEGKEIFCYFDNDEAGYAARNAVQMRDLIENRVRPEVAASAMRDTAVFPVVKTR